MRGEIDNTVEGRTTGWIWLLGRTAPVTLDLVGDCWRDLAGTRLKFVNPEPASREGADLADVQRGVVGDMTASRRCRVPLCSGEEMTARMEAGRKIPTVWKNTLYLEWFSGENGRVVIETAEFELELSERGWTMDGDAEEAQKLANLQAMRDFLDGMIARRPVEEAEKDDEFVWEQRLQESDRLSDAYQEVLEKYMDDPDSERKEAFVMGWDGLLDAMAAESEGEEPPEAWQREMLEGRLEAEADEGGESWQDEGEEEEEHPLQVEAYDLAMKAVDLVRDCKPELPCSGELVGKLMQVAVKLSGALSRGYEMEKGYVLAILKRCQSWQNDALAAAGLLIAETTDPDHRRALEALRGEVFQLRQQMTDLRRELKES